MRCVPLIEVDVECAPGSALDHAHACGLDHSAVCPGVAVELMLVAARELGYEQPCLRQLVLAPAVALAEPRRVLARVLPRVVGDALEVVSGGLGERALPQTLAFCSLESVADAALERGGQTYPARATSQHEDQEEAGDARLLAHVRRCAGGAVAGAEVGGAWIARAQRVGPAGLRLETCSEQLADADAYVLHPWLWEAAIAGASALMSAHHDLHHAPHALRADALHVLHAGGAVAQICIEPVALGELPAQRFGARIEWLDADGAPVARLEGLSLDAARPAGTGGGESAAQRRFVRVIADALGRVLDPVAALTLQGVTSMDRARIAAALAEDLGVSPALADVMGCESVAAMEAVFERAAASGRGAALLGQEPTAPVIEAPRPLSLAQRQVWALHALSPNTPRCHIHLRLACHGPLDAKMLSAAIEALMRRHASLRVVVDMSEDEPHMRVVEQAPLRLERIDLRAVAPAQRHAELVRVSAEHAMRPFDLERGPLLRMALAMLDADEHALLISAHHLIVDGFGLEVLTRELLALYQDRGAFGEEPRSLAQESGPLPGHEHEHETPRMQSGFFSVQAAAARVALARDPSGPVIGEGGRVAVAGLQALTPRLRELSQQHGVSVFALLSAAYAYVLARHVGQDEMTIGVVSSGRATLEQLSAVGMFARGVVLALPIADDSSWIALARDAHERLRALQAGDDSSPLRAGEGARTAPLAVTALYQQWGSGVLHGGELRIELELDSPDGAPAGFCRSELELLVSDAADGLFAWLQYDRAVLHATTAKQLASAMAHVLCVGCAEPDVPLDAHAWGDDPRAFARQGPSLVLPDQPVFERVEARARQHPDAVATRDAHGTIRTYRELIAAAECTATALRARGVGTGAFVGVVGARVADLPVAVLAIMKAGAAYVPIDPAHPRARIALALTDARVALAIAPSEVPDLGLEHAGVELCALAELVAEGSRLQHAVGAVRGATALSVGPRPQDAAYVLHTSGSTGTPKGVVVEHGSLSAFIAALEHALPSDAVGPWLALTTLAFDISIVELLYALAQGAEVRVGAAPSLRSDDLAPFAFLRTLGEGVRCFQCTPSLARLLLEDDDGRVFLAQLRLLMVGGEALPLWLAHALCKQVPGAVINMYGPTEATVWASAARMSVQASWVPIGEPLARTTFCVVNGRGHAVAPGIAGELWIGGALVARGYLDKPEQTRERFVAGCDGAPDLRMYRTGDLVRMRSSGEHGRLALEWLGRLDRQVKLAGNRVELGEVEGVLTQHALVRECAVVLDAQAPSPQIVACVSPSPAALRDFSPAQHESALLDWLASRLPPYMVPSRILRVPALPRTSSGKTDHAALLQVLAVERARAEHLQPNSLALAAPATPTERRLAGLWKQVLAREQVGRFDDFFALGGTSFAAVLLASRARRAGLSLSPATVLAHPVLAQQALHAQEPAAPARISTLADDVRLEGIDVAEARAEWPPRRIVLTGATGFLGAHLLVELHAHVEAEVVCIVRADSDRAARVRMQESLERWGLVERVQWELTRCVCGDIARPHFGLAEDDWRFLAEHSDLIVHNAANVNFALSYQELHASNVRGTRTAIELAAQAVRKPLHYVSTIAITDAAERGVPPNERTALVHPENLVDGYSQSKWVAEGLALLAADRGLSVTCYRAGPLLADRAPTGDAFAEALATVARTGLCFAAGERTVPHLTRVDDTARAIVLLALDRRRDARIEHVVSPQRLRIADLIAWIREWGFGVVELPERAWLERLEDDPWAAATMFVVSQRLRDRMALVPEVDHTQTLDSLAALGMSFRDVDAVLIQRLLSRLMGSSRGAEPDAAIEPDAASEPDAAAS